jgi:amino acid adenylation domain-containing protein
MAATAKRRVRDIYPLTAMQQGMLVHALRTPGSPVYQQQFVLAVAGVPDGTALRQGLSDLVARHTVLRTGFVWEGVDNPVQVVFAEADPRLGTTDLRGSEESTVDDSVRATLTGQWATPFDLRRPPLLRAHALRVGDAEWRLVLTIHHLVVDGWSMPTLQAELAELIAARLAGRPATLPPAAPFREFVTWLRDHDSSEAAAAHFKRLLGDLRHPTPLGIDRLARVSVAAGPSGRIELLVPVDSDRRPDVLARRRGLLPSTIAHAAWGLLLARCAGTPDAVFGTTVSGRPAELPGVTERVGMFVNTVPVRISVDGELPVRPWLAAVQEQLIAGRAFEHTPVVAAQRCSGVPRGEPLYESVLGFQNYFVDGPGGEPAGTVTVRALRQQEQTGLPLVVSVAFAPTGTWVRVEFDEWRIDRPTAEWLAKRYAELLGELAAAEETLPLRDIAPTDVPTVDRTLELERDEVVDTAVIMGERAWIVSPDGRTIDVPALQRRLRRRLPGALIPGDVRQLLELPLTATGQVDMAALLGPGPAPIRTQPQPLADRLAALPEGRRGGFLAALRTAQHAVPPIRPGRIRGPVPRSVQQEFYEDNACLRALSESTVDLLAAAGSALSYADYVAWQADPRRTAERDRQATHWKTVLRGAPASGIPADRVAPDASARGHTSLTVKETAPPERWLAALALVLARSGRDDDVVLGVVTRPVLPPELAGVPGPFSRMLPVRVAVGPGAGLAAVAESVAAALDVARRNADVPWPVLRTMLAEDPKVSVAVHDRPGALTAHAAATIGLDIAPDGTGTAITAVFDARTVAERTVTDLIRRTALVINRGGPVSAADLVTDDERAELLRLADGGTVIDPPATVPELVARQDPDTVAVVATDGELTYRQLLARAAGLAAELRARGVGLEDRVAVCLPRTSAMVWAPLGIMLAGAAYVPVDPKYPAARIDYLCADAGVSIVVTEADLESLSDNDLADHSRPAGAAYVIYTSGSTGQPKGVLVEHRAVVDFCRNIAGAYRIGPGTRLLGFAALTFDVSVFDLWAALCSGATLVLAGDEERVNVEALRRLLVERRVTTAELPPSLMPLLDPAELPDLRLVSVGGEAPPGVLVDEWAVGGRELWNGYGPAETTVAVTLMLCEPPSGGRIPPIGRPMSNHRAYVLDDRLRLVPPGVPGELCVAGAGLARGYLGRPGHTADRFVPDPFGTEPGARLYRTGDLARWVPDGVLEFLGRVDRQVKIRGFRVELGEVESVLAAGDRIRQVAVEVWREHLTAYVVPAGNAPTLAEVREIAAARLPDYMVPTRLAVLAELPRTPSGKIDRRALPAPPEPAGDPGSGDAAWTELERAIATEVLGPLLGLSTVERVTDFFELGGNSLQATQVTARVRDRLGVEIGLADFLAEPTVARLATLVEEERHRAAARQDQVYAAAPVPRMTPGTLLPQSFPQIALFQAEERHGHDPRYNAPFAVRMRGPLDLSALRRAFALVVRRHAPLRVSLHREGSDYLQRVLDLSGIPVEVSDVDGSDLEERERAVRRLVREEGGRPFDLAAGPLIRARVHRLGADDHVVQWTVHHAVIDGWSLGIALHEIGTAYHAYAEGAEPDLAPIEGDYAEFVEWHRDYLAGPRYAEDLAAWRTRLRGLGGITLPTPVERAGHTFRPGYLNLRIEPELAAAIDDLGRRSGTSLYMTGLAAYATVLAAHSGAEEIVVVTPNALRVRSHWEKLIGWFVNRVVLRVPVRATGTFADLLRVTREAHTAAFSRPAVPFETLRTELGLPDAALALCFSVQNAPSAGRAFRPSVFEMELVGEDTGIEFAPIGPVYAPVGLRYESAVSLMPQGDGTLTGGWEYDAALFDEPTARRWRAGLLAVLARAAAAPDTPVRELMSEISDRTRSAR